MNVNLFRWRAIQYRAIHCTILFLLFPVTCWSFQEPAEGFTQEAKVAGLWEAYLQAKVLADEDARQKAFERFKAFRNGASGEIFESAAYLFLEEGYKDLASKKYESARREFLNAAELNPYLWPAFMGLAEIKKDWNKDYGKYLELNLKGLTTAFDFRNSFFVLDAGMWWLRNLYLLIMLGVSTFALVMVAKYLRPFFSTTIHSLEHEVKSLYAHLFSVVLLMLPFLLGINYFLMATLYLALFYPFFESSERKATLLVFLISLSLPLMDIFMGNINHARTNPLLKAHLTQFLKSDFDREIQFLYENPGEGELKNQSLLTIGKFQKAKGDLRQALGTFEQIPTNSKFWALAQVNIGNIKYLAREYQNAIDIYKKALARNGDLATAMYNLSVVYNQMDDHQESENYRNQAARKNPELRSRIAALGGLAGDTVVDAEPNHTNRLWQAVSKEGNPQTKQWFSKPAKLTPIFILAGIILLTFIHFRIRNTALLAKICEKCGRIYYQSDSPNSEWCSQCVNLYIKKEDLPHEAKVKKYGEVGKYAKRKHLVGALAQVFLPGAKKLLKGATFSGLVTLFFWFFLLVMLIYPITDIPHAFMRFIQTHILTWVTMGLTVVYWVIFGLLPIWQED